MFKFVITVVVLVFATVLVALRSANNPERKMYMLPDEYLSEYVMTFENDNLAKDFESKFQTRIENVFRVDAHYKVEAGFHYFVAYGEQNGESTVVMVKTSEADIKNETLSLSTDCGSAWPCEWENDDCVPLVGIGILCGCWVAGGCFIWP